MARGFMYKQGHPVVSGHKITVTSAASTAAATYVVDITCASAAKLDSFLFSPGTTSDVNATFALSKLNAATTVTLLTIATSLPNRGNVIEVELPNTVDIVAGEVLRASYTHYTGTAQTVDFIMTRMS